MIKLAMTCNKNEQQQNSKNNAALKTKWTKTIWKNFHSKRLLARMKQSYLVTDDDDDDDINTICSIEVILVYSG